MNIWEYSMDFSNKTIKDRIPVFQPPVTVDLASSVAECIESRWWAYGPRCKQLENTFTVNRGGWALATNSCTSALNLIARFIRKTNFDEVIVPSITFISTAIAFADASIKVVPVDVLSENLLIDPGEVIKYVNRNTRAIVAVHLYGQEAEIESLRSICDSYGIFLIEDCAHRIGSLCKAPIGDFACYSFNAVKEAPAGEGGLLWCKHKDFEENIREISYLGMSVDTWQRSSAAIHKPYIFGTMTGLKFRMTDIAATFVLNCLGNLDCWKERRKEIFFHYNHYLSQTSVTESMFQRSADDSFLMYVIRVRESAREKLRQAFANNGISTSVHYPSITRNKFWVSNRSYPVSEKADKQLLTLPCFIDLDYNSQKKIIDNWMKFQI